jgi:threonylcarbamoyladenosine tRNA methylthiotransferase CDKAL1
MNPTRVYLQSFGCSANTADGEVLAGCLAEAGFALTNLIQDADVVIYNCCSVKGPTENRMLDLLKRVPVDKKVIVTGCLPLTSFERLQKTVRFDGVVGPAAGKQIVEVVNRVLRGERVVALEGALRVKPLLGLPRVNGNRVVSVVPVSYGCLGACSYCCVVFARGRLRSYAVEEVLERVRCDVASGAREFWLTAQDMGCYGRDLGMNLAALLKAVCGVPGDFRVRVGMMTPNFALDMLPELVEAFADEKVFKFLHLPVQSGDDEVLKRMNRCYSVEDFKEIVGAFRAAFPEVTLATDVICGFPSETKEAFENTLRVISDVQPDVVNVSKFFARPGTVAAKMTADVVEQVEIKRRSAEMAQLAKQLSLERNQRWLGWKGTVFIDEKGKVPNSWVGRNFAYKPVTVRSDEGLLGKMLTVKIVEAHGTYLTGNIVG